MTGFPLTKLLMPQVGSCLMYVSYILLVVGIDFVLQNCQYLAGMVCLALVRDGIGFGNFFKEEILESYCHFYSKYYKLFVLYWKLR